MECHLKADISQCFLFALPFSMHICQLKELLYLVCKNCAHSVLLVKFLIWNKIISCIKSLYFMWSNHNLSYILCMIPKVHCKGIRIVPRNIIPTWIIKIMHVFFLCLCHLISPKSSMTIITMWGGFLLQIAWDKRRKKSVHNT